MNKDEQIIRLFERINDLEGIKKYSSLTVLLSFISGIVLTLMLFVITRQI